MKEMGMIMFELGAMGKILSFYLNTKISITIPT
jgi:hypothetical protein